jgi:hypothetical protein
MKAKSFDVPPAYSKTIHQSIDPHVSLGIRGIGEASIAGSGQDAVVAEDLLDFQQVYTGFD